MRVSPVSLIGVALAVALPLPAQSVNPLGAGPHGLAPAEYHARSIEAERLLDRRDFAGAAVLLERQTAAYPWDGEAWRRLGVARYATRDWAGAAVAFTRADRIGVTPYSASNAVQAARAFIRAGQVDSSLVWLHRALYVHRYERLESIRRDSAFAPLWGEPRFQALVRTAGPVPEERTAGWGMDIDYLVGEVQRMNAVYSHAPLPDSIVRAAAALRARVATLSDVEIALGMQRLLAMLGQSHNNLYFPFIPGNDGRLRLTRLPLSLRAFVDGLYIVDAAPAYAELIGGRVVRFDDTPAERALALTAPLGAREGRPSGEWPVVGPLTITEVLHALGVTRDPGRATLTVVDRAGRTRVVTPETASYQSSRKVEAPKLSGVGPTPLALSRPDEFHWFTTLPGDSTMYVGFSQVLDERGEKLAQFGLALRRAIDSTGVRNVIVDVRRNNGGNTYLYTELLRTLVHFDAQTGRRLYVLMGSGTYSAAINFITDLDRLTNAVFVGEPSGSSPRQLGGDESFTVLPYSQLTGGLSSRVWQLTSPADTRHWIAPDVPVAVTAQDHFANRDAALEATLALIRGRPGAIP